MLNHRLRSGKTSRAGVFVGLYAAFWPLQAHAHQDSADNATGGDNASTSPSATRLNRTGHRLPLSAPLMRSGEAVGQIDLIVYPDDRIAVSMPSLLAALQGQVTPLKLAALSAAFSHQQEASFEEIAAHGVSLQFNSQTLEVSLELPGDAMAVREISLRPPPLSNSGDFTRPADVSAYMNVRSSFDYVWDGESRDPIFAFDGAARVAGLVLEGEGGYRPTTGVDNEFVRDGARLVYDDRGDLVRWTAGDLLTEGRGFQSAPGMVGVSISRSYQRLDPTRNVYPRGQQSFTVQRPSTVDVLVNGQRVESLQLAPGAYNLRDFPFFYGANNVQLEVEDEVGRRELVQFDLFFDRQLLQAGAAEFGAYAGYASNPAADGPSYNFDRPELSAFYRTGLSDGLTFGVNFQGDRVTQQLGFESVLGIRQALLGVNAAVSNNQTSGAGYAVNAVVQTRSGSGPNAQTIFLGVDYRSENFTSLGEDIASNPYSFQVFAGYSKALGTDTFFSATVNYSAARDGKNLEDYRAGFSRNFGPRWSASIEAVHQRRIDGESSGALITLSRRFGPNSSVRGLYDSSMSRGSLDAYTSHGEGVGAWYASADLQTDKQEAAANAALQYDFNRAEVTLEHFTPINSADGDLSQRTSLRISSSLAYANGVFGVGRPIFDAFAVAAPHPSLHGAEVQADLRDSDYEGKSGLFGGAVVSNIASYTDRSISYDVPKAPAGYNLGEGSIRAFPPYHGGYGIVVGSDYSVTAMGRLLDSDGQAIVLLAGTATEVSHPNATPITVFTNREGRFLAAGVRPGRWIIHMPTSPPSTAQIVIPAGDSNLVQLGEVRLN